MCLFQEGITATEQVKQWQFDTKETLEKLDQMREVGLAWQTHGDALDSSERLWTGARLENNPSSVWVTIYFLDELVLKGACPHQFSSILDEWAFISLYKNKGLSFVCFFYLNSGIYNLIRSDNYNQIR